VSAGRVDDHRAAVTDDVVTDIATPKTDEASVEGR
jgi:hypothetical protein